MDSLTSAYSALHSALSRALWPSDPAPAPPATRDPRDIAAELLSREGLSGAWAAFVADSRSFANAVDWSEPFIGVLAAFHVSFLLFVLRKRDDPTATIWSLGVLGVLALATERLNALASSNYERIARTNYFDAKGVFAATVFAGPLLAIMFVAVILLAVQLFRTAVKAKRAQLKAGKRR
ncbi:transmembrane protein 18-domain-containing protein [Hyaloraphidium curvatum]|nr:transmembrane protein 18-domain-containing protein [Hyaloraphidium curvatum]